MVKVRIHLIWENPLFNTLGWECWGLLRPIRTDYWTETHERQAADRIVFISSSPAQEMNIKCHNRFSQSVSPTGSSSGWADWMFCEACLVQKLLCLIKNTMTFILSAIWWHYSQSFYRGPDEIDIGGTALACFWHSKEAFLLNFLCPLWRHELFMFWHLPVDRIEIFISC